jgi:hypothetical protein
MPKLTIDLEAITTHLDALAGTDLCPHCDAAITALADDITHLLIEINRLYGALLDTRIQSANLRAAMRATLHAESDGETDPLAYLRDELAAQGWWA